LIDDWFKEAWVVLIDEWFKEAQNN